MKQCPICEQSYIPYMGDGSILILGSSPTDDELQYGRPFTGRNMQLWKSHLMKYAKLDFHDCRFGLLNAHVSKQEECVSFNQHLALDEIAKVSRVILVGADSTRWMTGYGINQVNGMNVSGLIDYHDVGNVQFFAISNPASVFASQGEYYFAVEKLGEWLNA